MKRTLGVRHEVKGVIAVGCKSIGGGVAVDPLLRYLSGRQGKAGMRRERRLSGRNGRGGVSRPVNKPFWRNCVKSQGRRGGAPVW